MSKPFFGGKIPESWIERAAIAGKNSHSAGAVHIGLEIWRQSNMRRRLNGLKLPVKHLAEKGFGRTYVRTALDVLESEGLIRVKYYRHKSPEITLITSRGKVGLPDSTPEADHILKVASAVQDRDSLGRYKSDLWR
jgi:hypothetical protein